MHDVTLPPQRVLVKDESSFSWLRMLFIVTLNGASFHCVFMCELTREDEWWELVLSLELNLGLLPAWILRAFRADLC